MTEIQNNLFSIKWPTGVDMPLNKTQTLPMMNEKIFTLKSFPRSNKYVVTQFLCCMQDAAQGQFVK